jgi:hypothetical protein
MEIIVVITLAILALILIGVVVLLWAVKRRSEGEIPLDNPRVGLYMSVGLAIGGGIGAILGIIFFDNPAIGIGVGAGSGMSIGLAIGSAKARE